MSKKLSRRNQLRLIGSTGALGLLAGCTGGSNGSDNSTDGDQNSQGSMTAWSWASPNLDDLRKSLAQDFKKQTGNKLTWQYYPFDDYLSKLTSSISSGSPPDTMALSVLWVPRFGDNGRALTLGDKGFNPDNYLKGPRKNSMYQGKLYSIPWFADCRLMVINKKKFKEAGLEIPSSDKAPTWDEFSKWLEALTTKDTAGYAMEAGVGLDVLMLSNGVPGYLTADGSKAAINSPEAIEAAKYANEHVQQGRIITRSPDLDEFLSGNAAMSFMINVELGRLQETDLDYKLVPFPSGPSGDGSRSWAAGMFYSIPEGSKKQDVATKFLEFLASDEIQVKTAIESGAFPASKSAYETKKFKQHLEENPALKVVAQEMEKTVPFPSHPKAGDMWDTVHKAAERIFQGQQSPKQSLDQAAQEIESYL